MSLQNKASVKRARHSDRAEKNEAWKKFERKPLSGFPRAAAVNVLANNEGKQTNPRRKRMRKALSSAIQVPRIQPKDPAIKLTQDLQRMPLSTLIRRIRQSARRASTCKHLAEKCTPGSKVQEQLVAAQTHYLGVMRQAQAEYKVRISPRA